MRHIFYSLLLLGLVFTSCTQEKTDSSSPSYKYTYETVDNDPTNTLIYTLDNGMKLYMSINRDEPRIQTNIAVKTGSKQDPADATGLAHYLEHMLFKGTSNIGTVNWEEEKVLLQKISDLYEQHRETTDPEERKAIYKEIDQTSNDAAKLAVANEYDKMISSIGAKGTNAYTSLERTVYINDIPSNELEKWFSIEGERFGELVLRLFHTELEAVYEEFNRAQDNDMNMAYHAMTKGLFKKHSYGTQTTIGTGEHLKNPSMVKIHEYFNERYAPNNMAIILAGDIDPDKTVDLATQYFGHMKKRPVPAFTFEPEDPMTEHEVIDVYGMQQESVMIAFRIPGVDSKEAVLASLVGGILSNGQAGLIDLNLIQQQKVLNAYAYSMSMKDYGIFMLSGNPRQGQSLQEVTELLLAEVEKIKAGDFEEWLIGAVVKDNKLSEMRGFESNRARTSYMTDAFIMDVPWEKQIGYNDEMAKITKAELIEFAKNNLKENYVIVNKNFGPSDPFKVEKPEITKIPVNRDTTSAFYKTFAEKESSRLKPVFVDYEKEIQTATLESGIPLNYVKNETNPTFSMNYVLEMGAFNDLEMDIAVRYLEFLGTDKYTPEAFQKELFKLGVTFGVFASDERIYVSLSGLEESLEQGVQLFEELLSNVKPDEAALQGLIADILQQRQNAKQNKDYIIRNVLPMYAKYGAKNPMTHLMPAADMTNLDPAKLVEKIKALTSYKHFVYYYGQKDIAEVQRILNAHHKVPEKLMDYPDAVSFVEQSTDKAKVLFVDFDMIQVNMMMLSKLGYYNEEITPDLSIFNQYFGAGLSSIVFQEIRESKALAYSAYSYVTSPSKPDKSHYIQAFVGTQFNKLQDAATAMQELMNDMPRAEGQFEDAKLSSLKKIETTRIRRSSIFWNYMSNKEFGRTNDLREKMYDRIGEISMDDLESFFQQNIKGRAYTYLVIGKKSEMDMEVLKSMGEFHELSLEEIFGY